MFERTTCGCPVTTGGTVHDERCALHPNRIQQVPPIQGPRIEFVPHDEQACEFCRLLLDVKRHHYEMFTPRLIAPGVLRAEGYVAARTEGEGRNRA